MDSLEAANHLWDEKYFCVSGFHFNKSPTVTMLKPRSITFRAAFLLLIAFHVKGAPEFPNTPNKDTKSARTTIPQTLEVPAFTPPAPPEEKKFPAIRVDAAITIPTKDNHTLTVIRGEASTLPDLPIPQGMKPQERQPLAAEEIAKIKTQRGHTLQLGATIYDHRISRVCWTHPATGESYEALCGFDLSLLQGLRQFTHDGESYHLMLTSFLLDTVNPTPQTRRPLPELPEVPPGSITYLKGNPKDPVGCATINILKDLITNEKTRLAIYQSDRLRYQKAAAEWEKAHPTLPRNETVWLRPHRGSRYLANPRPEAASK